MKRLALLMLILVAFAGCTSTQKAAVRADGNKYVVKFLIDAGVTSELTADQAQRQRQVASWMENDLLTMLNRAGYQAAPITNSTEYKATEGSYLLQAKISNYNPGSQAARVLVGFGAGAASLDIQYQLVNGHGKQLIDRADGVGSGRGWTYCCRELNQRMLNQLSSSVGS